MEPLQVMSLSSMKPILVVFVVSQSHLLLRGLRLDPEAHLHPSRKDCQHKLCIIVQLLPLDLPLCFRGLPLPFGDLPLPFGDLPLLLGRPSAALRRPAGVMKSVFNNNKKGQGRIRGLMANGCLLLSLSATRRFATPMTMD